MEYKRDGGEKREKRSLASSSEAAHEPTNRRALLLNSAANSKELRVRAACLQYCMIRVLQNDRRYPLVSGIEKRIETLLNTQSQGLPCPLGADRLLSMLVPLGFGGNAACRKHDNCIMPGNNKGWQIISASSQFGCLLEGSDQKIDEPKQKKQHQMPLNGTAHPG